MAFLTGLGIFIGLILLYVIVIVFFPVLSVPEQPIDTKTEEKREAPKSRQDVGFSVDGDIIRAWLYLPENEPEKVPCIIMSQGFGGTKDGVVLDPYAQRFNEAGFAALTYDFRHFGESDGEPRQLFDIVKQHDDLRAAINYARERDDIDPEKIFLWGTSASGGYGLVIAAEDHDIAGVIAQCPGIDHDVDSKLFFENYGIGHFLRLIVHAQRDKGRSRFGLSPHRYPIVGKPGTMAMLSTPGAFEGYVNLLKGSETFRNEVCARALLMAHGPDPVQSSAEVKCPILFLVCEHDNLASPESHKRAADILGEKAKVVSYPIGHFDIYVGEYFEKAVAEKIDFLKKI